MGIKRARNERIIRNVQVAAEAASSAEKKIRKSTYKMSSRDFRRNKRIIKKYEKAYKKYEKKVLNPVRKVREKTDKRISQIHGDNPTTTVKVQEMIEKAKRRQQKAEYDYCQTDEKPETWSKKVQQFFSKEHRKQLLEQGKVRFRGKSVKAMKYVAVKGRVATIKGAMKKEKFKTWNAKRKAVRKERWDSFKAEVEQEAQKQVAEDKAAKFRSSQAVPEEELIGQVKEGSDQGDIQPLQSFEAKAKTGTWEKVDVPLPSKMARQEKVFVVEGEAVSTDEKEPDID